jgi:hypothetical protein
MTTEHYATSDYEVTHSSFFDSGCDAYGTLYVCYPATGEEIIVQRQEPTTEVGRSLAKLLREESCS